MILGPILLLLAEESSHGYELHERAKGLPLLQDRTTRTLYRDLHLLKELGLVVSVCSGSPVQGSGRRVYEITEEGRVALDDWIRAVGESIALVDELIAGYEDAELGEGLRPRLAEGTTTTGGVEL